MSELLFYKVTLGINHELQEILLAQLSMPEFLGAEQQEDTIVLWFSSNIAVSVLEEWFTSWLHTIGHDRAQLSVERIPAENWLALWRSSLEPISIANRIRIVPFADAALQQTGAGDEAVSSMDSNSGVHTIIIEPKMAFGTGHHATTRMCVELMLDVVRAGSHWLDIGTGSGILAIVAAKLGAAHVTALDNDPDATANASENIACNGCSNVVTLRYADALTIDHPPVDGIVANLHHTLLVQLSKLFATVLRAGGWLIVSGILIEQVEDVETAFIESGFRLDCTLTQGEWAALRMYRQ